MKCFKALSQPLGPKAAAAGYPNKFLQLLRADGVKSHGGKVRNKTRQISPKLGFSRQNSPLYSAVDFWMLDIYQAVNKALYRGLITLGRRFESTGPINIFK